MSAEPGRSRRWCALGLEGLVAAALGAAGLLKLADPGRFAAEIAAFRLVGGTATGVLAVYLPWLELTVAAALMTVRFRTAGRLGAAVLLAVFSLALVSAWARGLDVECGCFGRVASGPVAFGLARNGLLLIALWGAGRLRRSRSRQ